MIYSIAKHVRYKPTARTLFPLASILGALLYYRYDTILLYYY